MLYRFGDCEVDLDLYERRRGGVRQAVGPQVFDVRWRAAAAAWRRLGDRYEAAREQAGADGAPAPTAGSDGRLRRPERWVTFRAYATRK